MCNKLRVLLCRGPPIESSTTFKYGDVEYKLDTSTLAVVCAIGHGAHGYVQKMQHAPSQTVMAVKVQLRFVI